MMKISIDDVLEIKANLENNTAAIEKQLAVAKLNLRHLEAEVKIRLDAGEKPSEGKKVKPTNRDIS